MYAYISTSILLIILSFHCRYGFNTPPNYNDHELYCGGFTRQYQKNGGKCGICGDPWDSPLVSTAITIICLKAKLQEF